MRSNHILYALFLALLGFVACTTEDVMPEAELPAQKNLYPIKDVAFAEYLKYNADLQPGTANALPYELVIARNDSFLLDVDKAARVQAVYLVKDSKRVEALEAAGVSSARDKIKNLDGIQFFANCTNLKLTANEIEGVLDLTSLSKLDTLEMNMNWAHTLKVPASVKRLRYQASTTEGAQRLSAINLEALSNLEHAHLTGHNIVAAGLALPASYSKLTYLDLSGNLEAPFTIPADLFNQLATKGGVQLQEQEPAPDPDANLYQLADRAFAEYLRYLETAADEALRLPAGTIVEKEGVLYLDTEVAATFTGHLNISKAKAFIETLTAAGVPTAAVKIANADGLQHFTALKELTATSNAFTAELPLAKLVALEKLIVRTAGVSSIDLKQNKALTYLDLQGSTSSSLGRLAAADLSANTKLAYVNLSANEIAPAAFVLPATYADLKTLNMGKNKVGGAEVTYTVPAALYDQLGTETADKAGLVRGE